MRPTKKAFEYLKNLKHSELKKIATKQGNNRPYKLLMEDQDFESASKMLKVQEEYKKYTLAWSKLDGKKADERIQLRIDFMSFLLEKICFPEGLN
jgi:hypothetical protein